MPTSLPVVLVLAAASLSPALAVAQTDAPAGTAEANAGERPIVLVLDFDPTNSDPETAKLISQLTAGAMAKRGEFNVLSSKDLQSVVALEADRQSLGCDDKSTSCLAEVAGAMGAELVVFGTVGQLGEKTIVQLNLFDSANAVSRAQEKVEVQDLNQLSAAIDRGVARLFGDDVAEPPAPAAASAGPLLSPLFLGGAIVGGLALVGASASGGFALLDHLTLIDKNAAGAAKQDALGRGPLLVVVASALGVVAVAGGAVAAVPFLLE